MNKIIPESYIRQLESTTAKIASKVISRASDKYIGNQSRGTHAAVRFGSIIESGGSGKIAVSKDNNRLHEFIDENQPLWAYLSYIFAMLCPAEAKIMLDVPLEYRIFGGMFTAGYWNLETISNVHRDCNDWRWCCAIAFDGFESALLDFPVINVSVNLKRLDICFFLV